MIRISFDCPETGEPLSSMAGPGQWPGRDDELVSMHCPKCSKLHRFGREQAILATEPGERHAGAAGVLIA